MNPLVKVLPKHSKFNELLNSIKNKEKDLSITGLTDASKAHVIYSLYNYSNVRPVVVCPNVTSAKKFIQDMKFYTDREIVFMPAREVIYYDVDVQSRETNNARVYAISKLVSNEEIIFVTTTEALLQPMLTKSEYKGLNISLKLGDSINLNEVIEKLLKLGYSREELVAAKGQFSVRGGIIDIFPVEANMPYRIELFGDEIDSIRTFDVLDQRSKETVEEFEINFSTEYIIDRANVDKLQETLTSVVETSITQDVKKSILQDIEKIESENYKGLIDRYFDLLVPNNVTLLDYFEDNYTIYLDDTSKQISRAEAINFENGEAIKVAATSNVYTKYAFKYVSFGEIEAKLKSLSSVYMSKLGQDRVMHAKRKEYSFSCREVNFFRSTMDLLIKDVKKYKDEGKIIALVFPTATKAETAKNVLIDSDIPVKYVLDLSMIDELKPGVAYMCVGIMSSGFIYDDMDLVVVAEPVSGVTVEKRKSSKEFLGDVLNSYEDLKVGDFVVHINHGIGKYLGVETVDTAGIVKDYMKLEYRDGGTLYIPITNLDSIKRYVCEDGFKPKLNKLGTKEWENTKLKVTKHVSDVAKELVLLYALRSKAQGHAFSKDTPWQKEFEADFEYELTQDQDRAIKEMKHDMEQTKPMDRLLCGDVGYGKTEVAIRGAFKAVMDSKQVAYLVPTTVLSLQQYNVFKERMEKFGVKVEMLSRFKTKKEQEEIVKKLELGEIDVVVGTHRILSKDVKFKDLGLLIIDEEHRFGVEDKEKIKKYKNNIDVLSMTATPIPRTLHMSMIGIRDVSIITEPPHERLPVHTYVSEYNPAMIGEAIEKELSRDGQVFYISNRVENIESVVAKVRSIAPEARVAFAHGQMTPNQIEDTMLDYMNRETDILVCTTILESGIDIPNANTIIIENADKLGLAQLYQIRGRVGRSNRLAYAYVTYNRGSVLTEEASKRLNAIKDYSEFGSGFKIALRDLEIRGAGNILGAEQHGHMMMVGYDMYAALLNKAVEKEKLKIDNNESIEKGEIKISLDVSANIPNEYISDSMIKIEMYQKLSNANNDEEIQNVIDELIDRFGDIPQETLNLVEIVRIRNKCKEIGIDEVKISGEFIWFIQKPKNHIKFRLTNDIKRDILSFVNKTLDSIIRDIK
ncbi:MAG: transcription-repair coupling factor [Clostridia bacterium]|nr:transcription-repair coupling factor [Clostridia bacterium]